MERRAPLIFLLLILALANGIGHSALALSQGGYFPGVMTAPLLLLTAGWMAATELRRLNPGRTA